MRLPCPSLPCMGWVVLGAVLLAGPADAEDLLYTVRPGDHPWNIAQRYLLRPALALPLAQGNGIADPHRIAPGTRLRIPVQWLRQDPAPVRLLAVAGSVQVHQRDGATRAAQVGESLHAPLHIATGQDGSATLEFASGARVLVAQDSALQVHRATTRALDRSSAATLELLRGRLENDVPSSLAPGQRFEIRMPAAIAAVRGTRFRVQARGSGGTARAGTEVLQGAVQLANPAGAVLVHAGQGSQASRDAAPPAPQALLPAPDLSGLPLRIERLPTALPFTPLAGANGYRVQLADDAHYTTTRMDEAGSEPVLQLPPVPDGDYVLRVRGINGHGLEGLSAEVALQVHARPEPPLLIAPAAGAQIVQPRPGFEWTQGRDHAGFRLQLFAGDGTLRLDEHSTANRFQPAQALPPGHYRWRVASIDASGRAGPFGDAQRFERVEAGPQAELAPPAADGSMVLRWSVPPGAAGYQVQLAREAGFAAPLLDRHVEEPQLQLPTLAPGDYLVRVRRVTDDGALGPWSEPQTFTIPEPRAARWPLLWLLLPLVLL